MRRMKNIRNYEVSIWTLQDSFITVLKQSNLENKEKIQDPKMSLKDDGENTFSFKIPMYLQDYDIIEQEQKNNSIYTYLSVTRDNDLPKIKFFIPFNNDTNLNFTRNIVNNTVSIINVSHIEAVNNRGLNFSNVDKTLKIDSKRKTQFSKKWLVNPIWYTTRNGNIIENMRKVKVIFNKNTIEEEVFEFIITKVTESHEGYSKYCEVECNGLAFHELGKQGYEISLSEENFKAELEDYYTDSSQYSEMPRKTLDYWVNKVLDGTNWEYIVYMNWAASDGYLETNREPNWYLNQTKEERDNYNNTREANNLRRCDKIYRDPYVSSWKETNNVLVAATEVTDLKQLEKLATVDGKNSNRYNLLQSIAEAFGVFCKFQYLYDDNYHIIGRRVIFYNNFISEENGFIDFTFGYNTSQLSRDIDSNDLISKMYVSSLTDTGTLAGSVTIGQSLANPSRENYLLNFDYLHQIQTISDEQYQAIDTFQAKLRQINTQYYQYYNNLIQLQQQIPKLEADLKTALDYLDEANKRIQTAGDTSAQITDGTIDNPPKLCALIRDYVNGTNSCYFSIANEYSGLKSDTLRIFKDKNKTEEIISSDIMIHRDNNNIITKITVPINQVEDLTGVYITFDYIPNFWSETIKKLWGGIALEQSEIIQTTQDILGYKDTIPKTGIYKQIEDYEIECEQLMEQKKALKSEFENFMGPALREGNWQPEDKYADYQLSGSYTLNYSDLVANTEQSDTEGLVRFNWYPKMMPEELELTYHYDNLQKHDRYYPCIDLSEIDISDWSTQNINFIYRDFYTTANSTSASDPRNQHYLTLNAENGCEFGFLRSKKTQVVIPVLIITGVKNILDIEENNIVYPADFLLRKNARISSITYTMSGLEEEEIINTEDLNNKWVQNINNYELVYPRFSMINTNYIENSPEHKISYGDRQLEANKDYYTLYKDFYYYTTIKPSFAVEHIKDELYTFYYALSTATEAVYLDAIDILKENAFPKVSYSISPAAIDESFIHQAYAQLGRLAHINDAELQFENVQGYISEVDLDLDKPWEDTYTIKNYKTKFEDLFSTIVAQTEEMKRNSATISMTANLFDNNGNINPELLTTSLLNAHIDKIIGEYTPSALQLATMDYTARLASSTAVKVMNGEVGLAFQSSHIDNVQLNTDVGLLLEGTLSNDSNDKGFFRVTNGEMGFFRGTNDQKGEGLLFFQNGDLVVKGQVKAASGWFGNEDGWIIGSIHSLGDNRSHEGGFLYSKNEQVILYAGNNKYGTVEYEAPVIAIYGENNEELFKFENNTLTVKGKIQATSLSIEDTDADEYIQNLIPEQEDLSSYAKLKVNSTDGIKLETGDKSQSFGGAELKLFSDRIDLSGGSINLTGGSINLSGGSINLTGSSSFNLTSGLINIYSSGQINMTQGRIGGIRANNGTWSGGWYIEQNRIYSSTLGKLNGSWPTTGYGIILHTITTGDSYSRINMYNNSASPTISLSTGSQIQELLYIGEGNTFMKFNKNNNNEANFILSGNVSINTTNSIVMTSNNFQLNSTNSNSYFHMNAYEENEEASQIGKIQFLLTAEQSAIKAKGEFINNAINIGFSSDNNSFNSGYINFHRSGHTWTSSGYSDLVVNSIKQDLTTNLNIFNINDLYFNTQVLRIGDTNSRFQRVTFIGETIELLSDRIILKNTLPNINEKYKLEIGPTLYYSMLNGLPDNYSSFGDYTGVILLTLPENRTDSQQFQECKIYYKAF